MGIVRESRLSRSKQGNHPFLWDFIISLHAGCLSLIIGVMPPRAMFGLSLFSVHGPRVA